MIGAKRIVSKRKRFFWTKKATKSTFKKQRKSSKFFPKNKKFIYWTLWVIFFIFVIYVTLIKTFLSPVHTINSIWYSKETVETFEDPQLYKSIKQFVIGKNYFTLKWFEFNTFIEETKQDYAIINTINLEKSWIDKVIVDIDFKTPSLIFNDWKRYLWSFDWNFFDVYSGSWMLSGQNIINLPEYNSIIQDFYGFYHRVPENKLKLQIDELVSFFWKENIREIDYLPWWSKTILVLKEWKSIMLNNLKNFWDQLNKFYILKNNYPEFDLITEFDLWSNDDIIVKQTPKQ